MPEKGGAVVELGREAGSPRALCFRVPEKQRGYPSPAVPVTPPSHFPPPNRLPRWIYKTDKK